MQGIDLVGMDRVDSSAWRGPRARGEKASNESTSRCRRRGRWWRERLMLPRTRPERGRRPGRLRRPDPPERGDPAVEDVACRRARRLLEDRPLLVAVTSSPLGSSSGDRAARAAARPEPSPVKRCARTKIDAAWPCTRAECQGGRSPYLATAVKTGQRTRPRLARPGRAQSRSCRGTARLPKRPLRGYPPTSRARAG